MSKAIADGDAKMLVDAHVHIHPGVSVADILDAAARNMSAAATGAGPLVGALLLTESAGVNAYADLPQSAGDWALEATEEPISRIARRASDGAALLIVAGRQIVTGEGVEAHALGALSGPEDGVALSAALTEIDNSGALAALPWGVGKWSGARGEVIGELIRSRRTPTVLLADSGVRPSLMARPALLAEGEALGRIVLAGTDPLPLYGEERKPGRYGFVAETALNPARPFAGLAGWLRAQTASPAPYGRLESLLVFVRQQVAMQVRKRLRPAAR
ncbi:MAG: hypothetical protein AAF360_01225 [Pseudomonadota bacterium]